MNLVALIKALRNQLPYAFEQLFLRFCGCYWTLLMRLRLRWWQVRFGPGLRCYGPLQLRRHPAATIRIGAGAVFRSTKTANPLIQHGACGLYANKGARIEIGNHCGFSGATLVAQQEILIGDRVLIGANVLICDGDHHPLSAALRASGAPGDSAPVRIADDVWLGVNVVVLKGVTIGAGAVVAANALVCDDVPAGAVVAGVPARIVAQAGQVEKAGALP